MAQGRDDIKKAMDVLELPADAPLRDVHAAYLRLTRLYSGDSIAMTPLGEEFSEKTRKKVLAQVEEAYRRVLSFRRGASGRASPLFSDGTAVPLENGSDTETLGGPYSGPLLQKIRENAGIELNVISKELKLRIELLRAIEAERFESLPEPAYLKVHLKNYAQFLRLDPALVTEDYLLKFKTWRKRSGSRD
jgi:hypothetical protein